MRRAAAVVSTGLLMVAGCSSAAKQQPSTTALVAIGAGVEGPADLKATVYAQGVPKASALALDPQGRLWIATADYSDTGQDALYVVPQAGAAPVSVVTGLHTPLGLAWMNDTLFVASKERVDSYSSFDGTSFASQQTTVSFPADVGEVNGIVLAPDGRLQVGISAPCDHCTPTLEQSGAIVSFRPDGSALRVDASGIRAPIGLVYYPGTTDLFVTMNQRDDLAEQTPGDWLSVVQPGQAWGFPDCYGQGGSACAGVPAPVAELDKHAAVSGVAIVTGQLGTTVGNAAIVAEWSTGKVQRVSLSSDGTTHRGTVEPFLTGLKNPVAVLLAPDGALFVGDWTTGTIYRILR
jgi:glucose/arabinose dehydrogenase